MSSNDTPLSPSALDLLRAFAVDAPGLDKDAAPIDFD